MIRIYKNGESHLFQKDEYFFDVKKSQLKIIQLNLFFFLTEGDRKSLLIGESVLCIDFKLRQHWNIKLEEN